MTHGMQHQDARLKLAAQVKGRLAPAEAEALEAHLLVCDDCFAAYVALLVRRSA